MDEVTRASYAAAGYGRRTTPVAAVTRVVEQARDNDVPVFWTRVEFPPGGDGGVWYDKAPVLATFDKGNRLAAWVPGVEPTDGDVVVTKRHASGFFGTAPAVHESNLFDLHAKYADVLSLDDTKPFLTS